jgi:hypothetical protein
LDNYPQLASYVRDAHKAYQKSVSPVPGGPRTYGEKTAFNLNAKNMDEGLHKLQDDPRTIPERGHFRDVIARTQAKLAKAGINMSIADIQALLWFKIQRVYKELGALPKGSDTSDYLDAAYALVQHRNRLGLPAAQPSEPTQLTAAAPVGE